MLSLPEFETQFPRSRAGYLVTVPTELSLVILTLFRPLSNKGTAGNKCGGGQEGLITVLLRRHNIECSLGDVTSSRITVRA
jgi:hypothetical protein